MRDTRLVLKVIFDRGKKGLPLERVYRLLFNPALFVHAYMNIYSNQGAMTKGTTEETVDAMSMEKIQKIIEDLRFERYKWTSVRRTYIPKANGKQRPLGIPTWSDKLLQEAMRLILDAYYEPTFSDHSHGFRPNRGCHTALRTIYRTWTGTKWFIEGDIKRCFDNIDHSVLLNTLREKIHDNRFLRLVENCLKAGYLEDWKYLLTLSGTPQGGIISPLLSNIYLDRLDKFVETELLPAHTRGDKRKENPEYRRIRDQRRSARKSEDRKRMKEIRQQLRQIPSQDPDDLDYRRLRYIRYADDFLLGFAGPKAEAEEIKEKIRHFLGDHLKLEMSEEKTLITHARSESARFLGYEIVTQHCDTRRSVNGAIGLRIPADVITKKCTLYMADNKPVHRRELEHEADFDIVNLFQAEYRGLVNYYLLASNVAHLGKLRWVMETSLLKTLAAKHKASVNQTAKKYNATVQTEYGPRKCVEVKIVREGKKPLIARFGGISLRRQVSATITDHRDYRFGPRRTELSKRLNVEQCELCGDPNVEVHHVRGLKDLKVRGRREKPTWMKVMAARQRKTLVVCQYCHNAIHNGQPTRQIVNE